SERHVSSTELLSHRSDLWVVIHGQVYDLSRYAEYHPGGDDILRDVAGKDATDEWLNVNHGPEAKELMKAYVIGHY
ncbi:MAG: cytochrome b5-like heme/steroid binding domain-containing protein, partial [Piptocephalis tieghemiana]